MNQRSIIIVGICACLLLALFLGSFHFLAGKYVVIADGTGKSATSSGSGVFSANSSADGSSASTMPLSASDVQRYNQKILQLAHAGASTTIIISTSTATPSFTVSTLSISFIKSPHATTSTATSTMISTRTTPAWPVGTVYPDAGALLPFSRIVAYYGNFYSTQMGVLGQYPAPEMIQKLQATVAEWQAADPSTPVIPALDYIAVTAQASPGPDGKYRLRMPDSQIDEAISLAGQVHGLVFLDLQVGLSNLQTEVPLLEKYLKMPQVELSVDPEFSIKDNSRPGLEIGTFDASDINYAANYLAGLVKANNLPPKILVVHRFTQDMVTNYKEIEPLPQVQIVMDMDGWGSQAKKITTYKDWIAGQPVQFTGFKLFYNNDLRPPSTGLLTPAQVLNLTPAPSYIQYQ